MPARIQLATLSPALARRIARTPLRRRTQLEPVPAQTRPLSTTASAFAGQRASLEAKYLEATGGHEGPHSSALAALLARLSLPSHPKLQAELLACLTHPSYRPVRAPDVEKDDPEHIPNNEVLSSLGNSLLGMFASEHLAQRYPLLPTETLKLALTAYVGPAACMSVAQELGVGVQGGGNMGVVGQGRGKISAGVPVRWQRNSQRAPTVGVAKRFEKFVSDSEVDGVEEEIADRRPKRVTFDSVVTATVRAFIGLIYQEEGIHAARRFVDAHFMSRQMDFSSLFSFKNPKAVLSAVIARHLAEAGVKATRDVSRIESRIIAKTGTNSINPLVNVGLFLPTGIKLAEGSGSFFKMAEHRAATNALMSMFLVRGDQGHKIGTSGVIQSLVPTAVHVDFPVDSQGVVRTESEQYEADGFGGLEANQESSKRAVWGERIQKAARTNSVL